MSPPPEEPLPRPTGDPLGIAAEGEFSPQERSFLLKAAHESIASALENRSLGLPPAPPHLCEPRGVFTTIYHLGGLRGCVGYLLPVAPLFRAVIETARAAAFEDARFPPLVVGELAGLQVSLSILSRPEPIRPEEIEIGRHGLLVKYGSHRGLLLPQVAVEHAWDRLTFLEQTCRKAGLPANAWQQPDAVVEAFTAEVFGEHE